jgi:Tat protein secretion system quality control protein TatD with DNase activity
LNQGEKNYPWNVLKSLEELSKIKKIEREKLAEKLNANVFKAFGIRVMQNNQLSEVK